MATHPFNLATAVGVAASLMQVRLPEAGNQMMTWLSNAAAPCALFLLGVTVALRPLGRVPGEVPALVAIKLVIHPVLVWLILSALGDFEPTWTYAAIIMAALPPALNIFVLSTQYGVDAYTSPTKTSPISANRGQALGYVLSESIKVPMMIVAHTFALDQP